MNFEQRIMVVCGRNGFEAPVAEALEFGYTRYRVSAQSYSQLSTVRTVFEKMKGVAIVRTWLNSDGGVFEGYVWVMDSESAVAYKERMDRKFTELDRWWQRYHEADEHTRRLMACGAVS